MDCKLDFKIRHMTMTSSITFCQTEQQIEHWLKYTFNYLCYYTTVDWDYVNMRKVHMPAKFDAWFHLLSMEMTH